MKKYKVTAYMIFDECDKKDCRVVLAALAANGPRSAISEAKAHIMAAATKLGYNAETDDEGDIAVTLPKGGITFTLFDAEVVE